MKEIDTMVRHITTGNIFEDLGFTPEEAAVARLKTKLHLEILRIIKDCELAPKQLEKLLGVPQPRVSELINGKIYGMTVDKLTQYLHRLGREVDVVTHQIRENSKQTIKAG